MNCPHCEKIISNYSNLKTHIRRVHSSTDFPKIKKTSLNAELLCEKCSKRFVHSSSLKIHMKKKHESESVNVNLKCHNCAMCGYSVDKKSLLDHYKETHNVMLNEKKMSFMNLEEFETWKEKFEGETNSSFVKESCTLRNARLYVSYACHRSGNYIPEGKGLRRPKAQGTNKIGALCPANIKLKFNKNDGTCEVVVVGTHLGHENEVRRLNLTALERKTLATKIASKIPFDDILDEIRTSTCDSNGKRLHLLTKKDLFNIESAYNLCSSSARHQNDAASVKSWIHEMQNKGNSVLFYKPQDSEVEEWPFLKPSDFMLVIMTEAQCEMLKLYGSNIICLDRIHSCNSYDFELITLMVVDDKRQGFPAAFLISNRSDTPALNVFFHYVKRQLDTEIVPNVLMTDVAEAFYEAWVQIMGAPNLRVFCTWLIDHEWRSNLTKIPTKELQVSVYKQLRVILEKRNQSVFNSMINNFYDNMMKDPDTQAFAKYFKDNYMNNYECWAYCKPLNDDVSSNMYLERMHVTLKHTYFKGKTVKRLDKAINAVMRLVRDKCIDRETLLNKGKISHKLQLIRSRHKKSTNLDPNLIVNSNNGWTISYKNGTETYFVQQLRENCECQLICTDCESCIHRFCCSCLDSSIKNNMCKHIHALCTLLKNSMASSDDIEMMSENGDLEIDKSSSTGDFSVECLEERKQKIQKTMDDIMNNIKTLEQAEAIEEILAPALPTLAELKDASQMLYIKG